MDTDEQREILCYLKIFGDSVYGWFICLHLSDIRKYRDGPDIRPFNLVSLRISNSEADLPVSGRIFSQIYVYIWTDRISGLLI